jgi:DNA-binding transcriptional regulator LsrR (DeoR family)
VYQGTVAKMGQRSISKLLGIHQETVALALRDLAARGHITITGNGNRRRTYHLHSDVFGQKQRADIEEVISSPSKTPRLASVRRG